MTLCIDAGLFAELFSSSTKISWDVFFIINYCCYVHVLVAISYLCADNHQVKVIFVSSRTLYYTTPWFPRVRVPSVGLQSTSSPCAWVSQKRPLLVWMSSSLQTGKCLSNTAFHWQGLTPPLAGGPTVKLLRLLVWSFRGTARSQPLALTPSGSAMIPARGRQRARENGRRIRGKIRWLLKMSKLFIKTKKIWVCLCRL